MNILQVCPHYIPSLEFGGPLRVAHGLSKALINNGHSVKVCTTNLKNDFEDLQVELDVPILQDGVPVYYEPTMASRYWGFSPSLYRRTQVLAKWADIVLVHYHYQFANWAGAIIARKANKPYVIFAHGSFNKWGIVNKSQWKKRIYLRVFERANINNALYIAFNAPEEKKLSFFSDKGVVVPSGIEPVEFENTPPYGHWRNQHPSLVNKIIFLYLGRLNPNQKGLDMLLPAFAKLTTVRDDVHLILAGPDERGGEAEVRQMISSLRIESHVALTGMVDGTEKLSILNDSDAYALVSPSEGTSIALLEAMYMGLPVIASNRVGLSSQILDKNTGIVVERDINQIFTALDTIANDAVQRQQMGQNAHALVANKYTWNMIAIDLVETLRERADL